MILEISSSQSSRPTAKKLTWKQQLKHFLYRKNKEQMEKYEGRAGRKMKKQSKQAQESFLQLFDNSTINMKDKMQTSSCHSYYSTYIPLKMQSKFDDELIVTFPYIKHMQERGVVNDRTILSMDISNYMKECKAKGEIDRGWANCLEKYICNIDSILAAQLYLEFKKHGTSKLEELHAKYGGKCTKNVFFERVCSSANYFKKYMAAGKSPFSVELHDEINDINMPKTMKMLFCCICMTYDCNQHTLDDSLKEKQYQYLSPKNIISVEENLKNAIHICLAHRELIQKGAITPAEPCSLKCYQYLNRNEWSTLQLNRIKLLSPMVKGVIRLGIEMFSYSPCDIWFLLTQENITCSHVFLFLIEEYNIISRLQKKLGGSQMEMLSREKQILNQRLPEPPKKKKKIRVAEAEENKEINYSITSCTHYYRGEEPVDINCENCACRDRGYCLPQCLCDDSCPIRKRGCNCKKQDCRTKKCICFSNQAECNPYICVSCFDDGRKKNACNNHKIMSGEFKKVRVGRSTIPDAGIGLFAGEKIKKDELLMIYSGEIIDHCIDLLRESLSVDNTFYNFGSPEGTIDARFMGNLSRFINHADQGKENIQSQNILTEGRYKIGFYALRDIEEGEQLFFDYDGQGILYKNYKDKYPFINYKKKQKQ